MKLETFFISSSRRISTKLLSVSESSIKITLKFFSYFIIQRLLYTNEIVQYFQNSKCYKVDQDHF